MNLKLLKLEMGGMGEGGGEGYKRGRGEGEWYLEGNDRSVRNGELESLTGVSTP